MNNKNRKEIIPAMQGKGDDKCSFRCNYKLIIFVSLYFSMKLCQWAGRIDSKQVHLSSAWVGKTDFLLRFITWERLGLDFGFFSCFCMFNSLTETMC